jgi:hypothetical protein
MRSMTSWNSDFYHNSLGRKLTGVYSLMLAGGQ